MAFELKENKGTAFENKAATGNQPNYKGDCLINGQEKTIALWISDKVTQKGDKMISFSITDKFKPNQSNSDYASAEHQTGNDELEKDKQRRAGITVDDDNKLPFLT